MTESSAIATNMVRIAQDIFNMNTCDAYASTTSTAFTTLLDTYNTDKPFYLSYQYGSTAYADACASLFELWDVQFKTFPQLIFNIRIHVNKMKWNAAATHGILSVLTRGNYN